MQRPRTCSRKGSSLSIIDAKPGRKRKCNRWHIRCIKFDILAPDRLACPSRMFVDFCHARQKPREICSFGSGDFPHINLSMQSTSAWAKLISRRCPLLPDHSYWNLIGDLEMEKQVPMDQTREMDEVSPSGSPHQQAKEADAMDVQNPQNWSSRRKSLLFIALMSSSLLADGSVHLTSFSPTLKTELMRS